MPIRTCVSCRTRQETRELIRLVARPDGYLWLTGEPDRPPGRGASCCRKHACLMRLVEQPRRLHQALRRSGLQTSDLIERAGAMPPQR